MSLTQIFVIVLCLGVVILLFGVISMLSLVSISYLFPSNAFNGPLRASHYLIKLGLALFFLSLAAISICFAVDGIENGLYKLKFGRGGAGETVITWENQPAWFVFQTSLFLLVPIAILFIIIKKIKKESK